MEGGDHLGQSRYPRGEPVDFLAVVAIQLHGNQGLHGASDRGQVQLGVVPGDDSALSELTGSQQRRGRCNADLLGELRIGDPCVCQQLPDDSTVHRIQSVRFATIRHAGAPASPVVLPAGIPPAYRRVRNLVLMPNVPHEDPVSDVVGLDIGGTKTHGVRWSAGEVAAEAKSGSANVQNVTPEEAARNLAELFTALGGRIGHVVAGSGGVDTNDDAGALQRLIAQQVPNARIDVVHDTRLILAAGAASTGIAVIAGTGSVAWGLDNEGRQARSGGWGYLLGDEGSGYWVGREAVRATLHRFNRAEPLGILGEAVLQGTGVQKPEELIALFHGPSGRRYWAGQAHLVFQAADAGDDAAQKIIEDGARHLRGLITDVASVLGVHRPVIIGGGLAVHQPRLQELLSEGLAQDGFDQVRFLTADPVHGVDYLLRTGVL